MRILGQFQEITKSRQVHLTFPSYATNQFNKFESLD